MARTQLGSSDNVPSSARRGRRKPRRLGRLVALVTVGYVAACGSVDSDALYGPGAGGSEPGDASADGSSSSGGASGGSSVTGGARATGGWPATGGARPQTGGSGGVSSGGGTSTGGTPTGGAPGSGGSLVDAGPPCEAPSANGKTALCIHFIPERIRARSEAALDKMGTLVVQIFDNATPDDNAPEQKLAEQIVPGGNHEISVDALPMVRFEAAFPESVYLRAVFVDNETALAPSGEGWGIWMGGQDLSNGLVTPQPILPVSVAQGSAQDLDMALVALRRLSVQLNLEITPRGDGEGPLVVTALRTATPTSGTPLYGIAGAACAKAAPGPVSVTGYFIGSGAFYLGALLNDLGATGTLPPGSLVSLDSSGPGGASRLPTRLAVAPLEYAASVDVPLNAMIPLPADPMIPPNSCADLVH